MCALVHMYTCLCQFDSSAEEMLLAAIRTALEPSSIGRRDFPSEKGVNLKHPTHIRRLLVRLIVLVLQLSRRLLA